MKRRVLVTDGEQRAALAVVRSLGRSGYDVRVCSARSRSIAAASRHCTASYRTADPLTGPSAFVADLARIAATEKIDVLLPVTEAALLAVLPARDRFSCAIPFASAAQFEAICDKAGVLLAGARHGLAVPLQTELVAPEYFRTLKSELRFPLAVKPSRSVAGSEGQRIRIGVAYARSVGELRDVLTRFPPQAYPLLLQQQINGPGFGISVLVWQGRLFGAFAHRRLREKPPSGGVSVLRESVRLDDNLLSRSLALLGDFDWQGVAMVEYKLDDASGTAYLMEINGRLWGSLQLAIDAGVDFPRLLVELALGGEPVPILSYQTGVRSRWEWGDVDHLIASLLHPSRFAKFKRGSRHPRMRALTDFVRGFSSRNHGEIFRRDDPGPIIRETLDWLQRR